MAENKSKKKILKPAGKGGIVWFAGSILKPWNLRGKDERKKKAVWLHLLFLIGAHRAQSECVGSERPHVLSASLHLTATLFSPIRQSSPS